MTRSRLIIAALLVCSVFSLARADVPVASELTAGVQAYQEQRWTEAMGHFLQVLSQDPANKEAHTYMDLLAQELDSQRRRVSHDDRLAILASATQVLDTNRMNSAPVQQALRDTNAVEADRERQQRHAQCTMAQTEAQLGHLSAANDLVLQVITQTPNDGEAQRLLSDLQSQIRQALDTRKDLPVPERQALEGFYAYGQADFASAAAAWDQAHTVLNQTLSPAEAAHQAALLHFDSYEKIAQVHLEEARQAQKARDLFNEGRAAYDQEDFNKSLENFRQVALINPDYAQLGNYLVQSEVAVERQRTKDLTDEKRQQATDAFTRGVASLEKGKYADAQAAFQIVLAIDPSHPQAREYMQQIDTQKNSQVDPVAAQQHYEAGVIAYVGGDSDEAVREWHIAHRLDPDNPKISEAVHKVERELVFSKELP